MMFLPIVERELREAARRRSTYWIRLASALTALLTGSFFFLVTMHRSAQNLGIILFVALAVVTFVYCLIAGAWKTSDCLSEEKRAGTLGLLFLTPLKSYDIVFGKLAATSLNTLYGMLAVFPVMAIPLLMGGVTGAEFGRVILVAVNNLFFSLAVGMFCSAVCRDERKSAALALFIVITLSGLLPVTGLIAMDWGRSPQPDPFFLVPSPGYACFMAFDETQQRFGKLNLFYPSLATIHLAGWLLLILACMIVPLTWREKERGLAARGGLGASVSNRHFRRRLLEINPFFWLAARPRWKGIWPWAVLILAGLVWWWGLTKFRRHWIDEGAFIFTTFVLHTILKLWLASEAPRRFSMDRRSGSLELILCTPLKVREIVDGQLAALWRQFAGPSAVVLLIDVIFAVTKRSLDDFVTLYVVPMVVYVADMVTLAWLGMWLGLRSRTSNRATAAAVARILVLPWVILMVLVFLEASRLLPNVSLPASDETIGFLIALAIALGVDLFFWVQARRGLLKSFRSVTAEKGSGP